MHLEDNILFERSSKWKPVLIFSKSTCSKVRQGPIGYGHFIWMSVSFVLL